MNRQQGPYDAGYEACPCFWGEQPGSLILRLEALLPGGNRFGVRGWRVLDLGCGEGKNAVHLARHGAHVEALDVSPVAIRNARRHWPDANLVSWSVQDAIAFAYPPCTYTLVIAYGLLHCLENRDQVNTVLNDIKVTTKPGGFNVLCSFNDRHQELVAHPGFRPCLLPHRFFTDSYIDWETVFAEDEDLQEAHPNNNIFHTHSLTRLIAKKPAS